MKIQQFGLYILKDDYFVRFSNEYLIHNKNENRPFYCSFMDANGIIWFIPLSSQIETYERKIEKDIKKYGDCMYYYIGKVAGIKRAFLIGRMFPVTEQYIRREYTIKGEHYKIKNKVDIKNVQTKAKTYVAMVKAGKLKPDVDLMKIIEELSDK